MSTEVEGPDVAAALRAVQEQLAVLSKRVAMLEAAAGVPATGVEPAAGGAGAAVEPVAAVPAPEAAPPAPAEPEELSEELLLVISAAIAAFLGKKPRIRQIRLVNSATWAQQGRVGIHASHAFARSGAAS